MIVRIGLVLGLTLGGTVGAWAQTATLGNTTGPAERPPASFTGSEYVDSRGCVFVRAGAAGAVRWVPRVTRSREVVCGQPRTATASAPAVTAAEPVIRRAPAPATPRVIAAPAQAAAPVRREPETVTEAAPAPAPRAVQPRPVRAAAQAPARRVAPTAARPAECGATDVSARYLRNTPACVAALAGRTTRTAPAAAAPPVVRAVPAAPAVRARPVAPPSQPVQQAPARAVKGCQGASSLSTRYLRGATTCWGQTGALDVPVVTPRG